jgi:hypothetical protein
MMVVFVLLPALCAAQPWFPLDGFGGMLDPLKPRAIVEQFSCPIRISDVSVKPLLAKQTLNLRDQVGLTNRGTIPQLSVAAELPGWFELKYLGRPRRNWDETIIPVGPAQIGEALFNADTSKDAKPKPVDLQWWTLSHQFELVGRTSWPIQPYVVAHLHQVELTGRGVGSDGKTIEGTELFAKWFPGVGVAFRVPFVKVAAEIKAAAWQDFSTITVALRYSPIPYVTVGAEYLREDVRIGDLHHRIEGPMLSVGLQF